MASGSVFTHTRWIDSQNEALPRRRPRPLFWKENGFLHGSAALAFAGFPYGSSWRGRWYAVKQVEAFAVQEESGWLVITVIARYF